MARTTGLVTVEVAEMLAEKIVPEFGVMPPERLGQESELIDRLLSVMRNAGIRIHSSSDK